MLKKKKFVNKYNTYMYDYQISLDKYKSDDIGLYIENGLV